MCGAIGTATQALQLERPTQALQLERLRKRALHHPGAPVSPRFVAVAVVQHGRVVGRPLAVLNERPRPESIQPLRLCRPLLGLLRRRHRRVPVSNQLLLRHHTGVELALLNVLGALDRHLPIAAR